MVRFACLKIFDLQPEPEFGILKLLDLPIALYKGKLTVSS